MSADQGAKLEAVADEVARIAAVLDQIRFEHSTRRRLGERAKAILRARRGRDAIFGADLFGEPAFDILLDLYVAFSSDGQVSVSSACIAAAVSPTTALRWLTKLQERGLIVRHADPFDRRRAWVTLSRKSIEMMERFLEKCPAV